MLLLSLACNGCDFAMILQIKNCFRESATTRARNRAKISTGGMSESRSSGSETSS